MIEAASQHVRVTYTNWRGETAERVLLPRRLWFGSTTWHPEPQWLLDALDVERNVERTFALAGISRWATLDGTEASSPPLPLV